MQDKLKKYLEEKYPEEDFVIFDGFGSAFLGVAYIQDRGCLVTVYNLTKCLDILQKELGGTLEEAEEFFDNNVAGSHVGNKTPIFVELSELFTGEKTECFAVDCHSNFADLESFVYTGQ